METVEYILTSRFTDSCVDPEVGTGGFRHTHTCNPPWPPAPKYHGQVDSLHTGRHTLKGLCGYLRGVVFEHFMHRAKTSSEDIQLILLNSVQKLCGTGFSQFLLLYVVLGPTSL